MNDNDWIKQLQAMMERHEEPVGNDLWQDIEARLPEQRLTRRATPTWRRHAAAAAVVLAIVGTGALLWLHNDSTSQNSSTMPSTTEKSIPQPLDEVFVQDEFSSPDVDSPTGTPQMRRHTPLNTTATATTASIHEQIAQAITTSEGKTVYTTDVNETDQETQQSDQQVAERLKEDHQDDKTPPLTITPGTVKSHPRRQSLTLSLYASNNFKPESMPDKDYAYANEAVGQDTYDSQENSIYLPEDIYRAKHHAPYSLGVSVRVPLNDRIALTSGVAYTRLKSNFTSAHKQREQTLHYLGIPLGVTYTLWQYKRLNVYAIGGVQADFNVKATLKDTSLDGDLDINKDRMQFSGLLGPGMQLEVTQGFGIYVEPTARYYFNNGSKVENYFKDKPWNINLNAGLRLTLQ